MVGINSDPMRAGLAGDVPSEGLTADYLRFLREAERAIAARMNRVLEAIDDGTLDPGLWHPTGFATFEITTMEDLGLMRLHIWPRGIRRSLRGHPEIHKHSFHLYSRVLAGEYRESQYEITATASDGEESDGVRVQRLRQYVVQPYGPNNLDVVVDSGHWVDVTTTLEDLRFDAGSWHDVEVGQYHSTPIPIGSLCATVAILGRPIVGARDVLLGAEGFKAVSNVRPRASQTEHKSMMAQLKELLRL